MIKRMKYPGYFLIVWDFIRYARDHDIPVGPGSRLRRRESRRILPADHRRGSTRIRVDLRAILESLNACRFPDIDIDFCERRRGEVIEYVTQQVWP